MGQSSSQQQQQHQNPTKDISSRCVGISGGTRRDYFKKLPPLDASTWKQGSNKNTREPFKQIVFLNKIFPYVCEEVFECVRLASISRDWRDCLMNYSDETWTLVCKKIQQEFGFQLVFMSVLRSDKLLWALNACFRQREQTQYHIENNMPAVPCLDVNTLMLTGNYPPIWVAAKAKQIEVVRLLLQCGAHPGKRACGRTNDLTLNQMPPILMCLYFTEHATSTSYYGGNTNEQPIKKGENEQEKNLELMKVLLEAGALTKPPPPGNQHGGFDSLFPQTYPCDLFVAACKSDLNDERALLTLLENQDFLSQLDTDKVSTAVGRTDLLHLACSAGFPKVVDWLITFVKKEIKRQKDAGEHLELASTVAMTNTTNTTLFSFCHKYLGNFWSFINEVRGIDQQRGLQKNKRVAFVDSTFYSRARTIKQRVDTANVLLDHCLEHEEFLPHLADLNAKGSNAIHLLLQDYHHEYFPLLERIFKRHGRNGDFVNVRQNVVSEKETSFRERIGKTCLYLACWNERVPDSVVEMMLKNCGVSLDLELTDSTMITPRKIAQEKKSHKKVELLDNFLKERKEVLGKS